MATLEQIKPYLDKQIGLHGYLFMDWDPTGEGYGHQEIFVSTTNNPEWYILNLPDYSDKEHMWTNRHARVEFLGTWPNIRRYIGAIPYVGKDCLTCKNWRLDIEPQSQEEENKPQKSASKRALS